MTKTKKVLKITAKAWAVTAVPKWGFIGFMAAKKAGYVAPALIFLGL